MVKARKYKKVALLMGGWSHERDVSLVSGKGCTQALLDAGYQVTPIDVTRDLASLMSALTPKPDVVFNALHGAGGEDGTIQGVLDMIGVPYTHSGLTASAVAMDKSLAKELASAVGIQCPQGQVMDLEELMTKPPIQLPCIVKPVNQGSTVGLYILRTDEDWQQLQTEDLTAYGDKWLVEDYIPGKELTVGVMGDRAMCVTEVFGFNNILDYEAKYTPGIARHVLPAEIPGDVYEKAMHDALLAHQTLGCEGVTRTDFRYDDTKPGTEGLYFLEINTHPGMTPISFVPEQAAHLGISYSELVSWMVENARVPQAA